MMKLTRGTPPWTAPVAALMLSLLLIPGQARKPAKPPPAPKFDREQIMMMNLTRGPGSTGFYVVQSLRHTKEMVRNLDKALRQLEQVEKSYAKSRGRPDDRPLASSAERIRQAHATAGQLETQLREAFQDLKSSVSQTLAVEGGL
ncbi:MAG TPA: hypothetical protein V6D08_08570 [Candidatus Obscuribacterales bacterium]